MKASASHRFKLLLLVIMLLALAGLVAASCHYEGPFVNMITDEEHFRPPSAPPTFVYGQFVAEGAYGVGGAEVTFYSGDGGRVDALTTQALEDGTWEVEVPGLQSYTNLLVYAAKGGVALLGIVPEIPRAAQVYDPPQQIDLSVDAPAMHPIDEVATAITLLIEGRLRQLGRGLNTLSPGAVRNAMEDIEPELGEGDFLVFFEMVTALLDEAAAQPTSMVPVFLPPSQIAAAGSALNPLFLTTYSVDYTGDSTPDTSVDAFEEALGQAMMTFNFDVCYHPRLIRVVFQVDFREGELDGNCEVLDRLRWLDGIDPGDQMFIVGGVHEEMIRCDIDPDYEYCATQEEIDLTNQALGTWSPNRIQMFDDGTNGDAVGGDGIYSRAFDLPRGMRIGYKFTYGPAASQWTGTEEWPGNQRLLEFIDVNGDGMVVRHDNFGDETTNKDKANLLAPLRGGRGNVLWDCGESTVCCGSDESPTGVPGCVDANRDGYLDFREVPIDTDRNCEADAWPSPGPVTPLTVECEE
ncbi:MAG: hypothetical protein JW797_02965 [Bradymonadales bacterium]|nr:hypothetical protein [Bradymonadales bacterium]